MKYKLFGMLQLLVTKTGYLEDGIDQRLRLVANILNVKGHKINVEGIKISFKANLPINVSDVIRDIRDSLEFIPLLVSLGWLPDIDNPAEVLEQLEQQKLDAIKLNQKALGNQSNESLSDLDEVPEHENE